MIFRSQAGFRVASRSNVVLAVTPAAHAASGDLVN
jgi:hypothetical protein